MPDVYLPEAGILSGYGEVAHAGQFAGLPNGVTPDGGNDGLWKRPNLLLHLHAAGSGSVVGIVGGVEGLPRGERPTRAGEDDYLCVVVGLGALQGGVEQALDVLVDGVEDGGAIEDDANEAVALFVQHVVRARRRNLDAIGSLPDFGHVGPPCRVAVSNCTPRGAVGSMSVALLLFGAAVSGKVFSNCTFGG